MEARRRGSYAKTAQRRRDILRTALEVFTERGYEAASFREIAHRVGMSETGLAHHFGGKSALLAAVLAAGEEDDKARWGADGVIPPERLPDLVAQNAERRGIVQLFTKLSAEGTSRASQAHEYFTERYARLRRLTANDVRSRQQDGTIRPDVDPDVVAQVLLAVMDGLQVQWLYDQDVDMVAGLDLLLETWLAPRPSPEA
ncbi:TetR family transcriptional regulator [Actinoplanes cyaneus]|uniref:TetR family transcriptional regulator n=1 Tax=Actinoplanes cyaneus TaxID=52696 RepID=A0A919M824_9ACTN|nr:TetR/AcrR family transcriptional regulator [Actinoplanes cyaneus]MCW2142361.1 transcriptional regulator, TetR family [Actinoplanes cyaneus]GID69382.1 TetR family transcriptional regulator [Actinoplanes cyaneus]